MIEELKKMGQIPDEDDMDEDLFWKYHNAIDNCDDMSVEDAKILATIFSDDCHNLNWTLLHKIETMYRKVDIMEYVDILNEITNEEFGEMMFNRLNNA